MEHSGDIDNVKCKLRMKLTSNKVKELVILKALETARSSLLNKYFIPEQITVTLSGPVPEMVIDFGNENATVFIPLVNNRNPDDSDCDEIYSVEEWISEVFDKLERSDKNNENIITVSLRH